VFLIVCDLGVSTVRQTRPELGFCATEKNVHLYEIITPINASKIYIILFLKIIYIFDALIGVIISYNTVHGRGTY
jgi:hypothetical protein